MTDSGDLVLDGAPTGETPQTCGFMVFNAWPCTKPPFHEGDHVVETEPLPRSVRDIPPAIGEALLREAESLEDYAREVSPGMTREVLHGAAERLRATLDQAESEIARLREENAELRLWVENHLSEVSDVRNEMRCHRNYADKLEAELARLRPPGETARVTPEVEAARIDERDRIAAMLCDMDLGPICVDAMGKTVSAHDVQELLRFTLFLVANKLSPKAALLSEYAWPDGPNAKAPSVSPSVPKEEDA